MTRVYGLVGSPVAHSLSPRMHSAWIAEAGLDASYLPFETPPGSTGEAILSALSTLGIAGANLTVPFKVRVIPHLAALDPVAQRTGAVNTVVFRDGRWVGSNTDAPGFAAAVHETGHSLEGAHVVVLGAGGAGRAVAPWPSPRT
jgi:shikimate dehydrogenase